MKSDKKKLRMAIVEDSRPYLKFLSMFLYKEADEKGLDAVVNLFDNPIDFKVNRESYDIVILDYVFRQYTYGANGFYLAKFVKERLSNCYVIIHSSYGRAEIKEMLKEFSGYVDAYSHKESDVYEKGQGLVDIVRRYIENNAK